MPRTWKTILLATTAGLVIAVAGCGGDDGSTSSSGKGASNQTDAAFAAAMLPHHQAGVKLGMLAAEKGINPQVRQLGKGIVEEQSRQAQTLTRLVRDFGAEEIPSPPIDQRGTMDMAALMQASDDEFDRLWLDVISAHHGAAIQMAQIESGGGQAPEAKKLAQSIIRSQSEELTQFNRLVEQMQQ